MKFAHIQFITYSLLLKILKDTRIQEQWTFVWRNYINIEKGRERERERETRYRHKHLSRTGGKII